MTNKFKWGDLFMVAVAMTLLAILVLAAAFSSPDPVTTPWARNFLRSTNAADAATRLTTLYFTNLSGVPHVITNTETGATLDALTLTGTTTASTIRISNAIQTAGGVPLLAANRDLFVLAIAGDNGYFAFDGFGTGFVKNTMSASNFVGSAAGLTNYVYASNSFNLFTVTNRLPNFAHWIGDSNGALISLKLSNGVVFFNTIQP